MYVDEISKKLFKNSANDFSKPMGKQRKSIFTH